MNSFQVIYIIHLKRCEYTNLWNDYNLGFDKIKSFTLINSRLPWDQLTFIGYMSESLYTLIVGEIYVLASSFTLLFVSICLYLRAFSRIFRHFVYELNRNEANRNNKDRLCRLIRFHNEAKEWVHHCNNNSNFISYFQTNFRFFVDSADVFSIIILIQLFSNIAILSGNVLFLDLVNNINSMSHIPSFY